jgi:hypothetical protein
MTAIKSKIKLNNRQSKRAYKNEAVNAVEHLQHIIDDFVETLETAPEKFKYNVIYLHYLDKWNEAIKYAQKRRFKFIHIDKNFFANEYAPEVRNEKKFPTRFELILFNN